mgnify:CR=1 FL=1
MTEKIKVMYFNKCYKEKPTGAGEIALIQKSLKQTEISISELAEGLAKGCTFKPAYLKGTKSSDWSQQQLFALDFDEGTTIMEELQRCKTLNLIPVFGYTSFSHTENHHKFRLVFCTEDVITDLVLRNQIQESLMQAFPSVDQKCKDPSRLFFGGKSLICQNYNARIQPDLLLSQYSGITSTSKKTHSTQNLKKNQPVQHTDQIDAIKHLNVNKLRGFMAEYPLPNKKSYLTIGEGFFYPLPDNTTRHFSSRKELSEFMNRLNLAQYLGVPLDSQFSCILPKHEDQNPSAHIYRTYNNTPIYKCFGCNAAYGIVKLTSVLANCTEKQARQFIMDVYGICYEDPEWIKTKKKLITDGLEYLDTKEFRKTYPSLSSLLRYRKHHYMDMCLYYMDYMVEELQYEDNPIFFTSYSKLKKIFEISPNRSNSDISKTLTLFSLLGIIQKLNESQIPQGTLKTAKGIASRHNLPKISTFFVVTPLNPETLSICEENAKKLKASNFTIAGLSREYVLRTFGTEMADQLYPQFKRENQLGTGEKSDYHTHELVNMISVAIKKNGYIFESEIKEKNEKQWKRSIFEILEAYQWKKVRLNKKLKEKYHIERKGFPAIIIPEEIE